MNESVADLFKKKVITKVQHIKWYWSSISAIGQRAPLPAIYIFFDEKKTEKKFVRAKKGTASRVK